MACFTQGKNPAIKFMLTLLSAHNERFLFLKIRISLQKKTRILSQNLHILDDLPKMEDGKMDNSLNKIIIIIIIIIYKFKKKKKKQKKKKTRGVSISLWPLPFTLTGILRQKKNYGNSNIFHHAKTYNFPKKKKKKL
jgi:hypothetical protein